MITRVSEVTVVVRDTEEALQFYTEKLGFAVATDMPMGEGRMVTVIPQPGVGTELILFNPRSFMPAEPAEQMLELIGKMPGIVLHTDDCRKTIGELEAKGVKILSQPTDYPYGVEAVFADLYGNAFVLVEMANK
jgi:predicted enzyme related to lactoylglutathione lyase